VSEDKGANTPIELTVDKVYPTAQELVTHICTEVRKYQLTDGPRIRLFRFTLRYIIQPKELDEVACMLHDPMGELRHQLNATNTHFVYFGKHGLSGSRLSLIIDTRAPTSVTTPAPVE